jgi:hypothetical protein
MFAIAPELEAVVVFFKRHVSANIQIDKSIQGSFEDEDGII